jgi:hypothetical protein
LVTFSSSTTTSVTWEKAALAAALVVGVGVGIEVVMMYIIEEK